MRDIREEPVVQAAVDAAHLRWPRADDAWQAVVWTLARDPFGAGPPVTESGLSRIFVFEGVRSIGLPSVRAVYTIEATVVTVHEVVFEDGRHFHAGNA